MTHRLYTVGHSVSPLYTFLAALKKWKISLLVDVRSQPRSRRFPHFNQISLEKTLKTGDIGYLFLGHELGGRPAEANAYGPDGVLNYALCRKSPAFHSGLRRIQEELVNHDLALMCAEEDPLQCHRFLMICPDLAALGLDPLHIRKGAVIETQADAEDRLLTGQKLAAAAGDALFSSERDTALQIAYAAQAKKSAYRIDTTRQAHSKLSVEG